MGLGFAWLGLYRLLDCKRYFLLACLEAEARAIGLRRKRASDTERAREGKGEGSSSIGAGIGEWIGGAIATTRGI